MNTYTPIKQGGFVALINANPNEIFVETNLCNFYVRLVRAVSINGYKEKKNIDDINRRKKKVFDAIV